MGAMTSEQALHIALIGIAFAILIPIIHGLRRRWRAWRMTHPGYQERILRRKRREAESHQHSRNLGYRLGRLLARMQRRTQD